MPTKETAAKTPRKAPAAKAPAPINTTPIRLGNIIRDRSTGFEGVANMKVEMLDGSTQFAIQPQIKSGEGEMKLPDGLLVDVQLLEFISDGVADAVKPGPITPFILGEEFKDEVTGFKGIAVDRVWHLNGCVHYTLSPSVSKTGEYVKALHVDWKRMKRIGKGVVDKLAKGAGDTPETNKTPNEQPEARTRGGAPSRSLSSFRAT